MNAQTQAPTVHPAPHTPAPSIARPPSYLDPARRRDFGVGYGRSSGYANGKHYAENWGNARFQCG